MSEDNEPTPAPEPTPEDGQDWYTEDPNEELVGDPVPDPFDHQEDGDE